MTKRYAIDIRLYEVDAEGNFIEAIDVRTTEDVSSDLAGMKEGFTYLRETLGNVMYDHQDVSLTNRYSGEPSVAVDDDDDDDDPGDDDDEIDEDWSIEDTDCFLGDPFDDDDDDDDD